MKLGQAIIAKTTEEIVEKFLEENEKLKSIILYYKINSLNYTISPIKHPYSILCNKAIKDKEFIDSFIKIKLNWYKRNLALLEILAEKHNPLDNSRIVFKIVRENLDQKHISKEINFTYWYKTFKTRKLTKRLIQEIFL